MDTFEFIWQPKFTRMLEGIPNDEYLALVDMVINYGTYYKEPDLTSLNDPILSALFEGFRDDIDRTRRQVN